MTNTRKRTPLTAEQETLLIPLYSRAVESQRPNPIVVDPRAQEILEQLEVDVAKLEIPRKTAVMICMRAKKIDDYTRQFLADRPRSVVIHLGCGLDSRYSRVKNAEVEWFDLDMREVIDLRRRFYDETASVHMIPSSVTDLAWIDMIAPGGRPVLVVAEGLFMYLQEKDAKALVLRLNEAYPGCHLVFDAFSQLAARSAGRHPSIRGTGAALHWGIDDPKAIEQWAAGIHLQEEWFFAQSEDLEKLSLGYRLGFRLAGLFPAANRAHRLLYYTL